MKNIILISMFVSMVSQAKSTEMICQIETCGPDSHVRVSLSGGRTYFDYKRTAYDFHFSTLFQKVGIIQEKQIIDHAHFSFAPKDCVQARDKMGDFFCGGMVEFGMADVLTVLDEGMAKMSYTSEKLYSHEIPWEVSVKSIASTDPRIDYTWLVKLTNQFVSHEEMINLTSCTIKEEQ